MRNMLIMTAAVLALMPMATAHADITLTPAAREAEEAPSQHDVSVLQDKSRRAMLKLHSEDYKGAASLFGSIVSDPSFTAMPDDFRFAVLCLDAGAESAQGHYDAAFDLYRRGGDAAPASRSGWYWADLAGMALATHHDDIAVDAITTVATDYPEILPELGFRFISQFDNAARRIKDTARERKLLEALRAASYTPESPAYRMDSQWFHLLAIYADAHEDDKARALLPEITAPNLILQMRIDNRYRPLIVDTLDHYDLAQAQARDLDSQRQNITAHPELMAGASTLAHDLMQAGRLDEALVLTDDTLARYQANHKSFNDASDQLNWMYDTRSGILARMGRWDEAVTTEIEARDVAKQQGRDLVSQYINLADLYYDMNRPKDTLASLEAMGDARSSPYGIMSADEAKVCAYAQLKDDASLKPVLDYVKAHADDGFAPYRSAMECAGDVDGLAQTVIARLDDPMTRTETLAALQTYMPLPHPTPVQANMEAVWLAVTARSDVQQAAARYGVIESVPTYAPTY